MSTDLPPLTDMKPRLVTTLLGNPGGRVMQSFVRAPWSGDYYEATVDSVVTGQASNLRISRCGADGTLLDYAVLEGAGHGAAITAEYDAGQVWIWLFWGSDVGHPTGTAVRWAYNGTPNGARVLLADAETVPDPGAGDPGHINGYFAIDQAKDRIATKFSSGTTETYTLWKLSDYKAGTGSPLFTAPTTWPTGDLSAFQGFTTSDKSLYITRGGSQPSDQAPTLYELDWATGAITNTLDISQLAATTSAGPDGGHNEAEGVCLWRDSGGNPELLFGIDTGPTSNRRGLVFRLAAPVDGTKTKTVQIDAERVIDGPATNVVAAFSYDRTVRYTTGGFTPTGYADPVKLSEQSTAVLSVSDHPDLTDDSYGFVIHAKLSWDDAADPGRRKTATYTAQLSAADPAVVNLSQALVATGAIAPGQVIAGAPGHSPVVTMVGDQVAVDGVVQGEHLTADATAAQQAAAQSAQAAAASAALVGAPAGSAIDAHLGGDSTGLAIAAERGVNTRIFVSPDGSDANAGMTESGAKKTLAAALATMGTKAGVIVLSAGVIDAGAGCKWGAGAKCGLVGQGPGRTVIQTTAQNGPALDLTAVGANLRGSDFGGFTINGDGVANPASKGIAMSSTVSITEAHFHDIKVLNTGGPCFDLGAAELCDFDRLIATEPVSAGSANVPYVTVTGPFNGNRFTGLQIQGISTGVNVGAAGAFAMEDNGTYAPHDNTLETPRTENLHLAAGATAFAMTGFKNILSDPLLFDTTKVIGATGTSFIRFTPPAVTDSGANQVTGTIPGCGGAANSVDCGIDMRQSRNSVRGTKGYNGSNVVIASGVGYTTVHLAGAEAAATNPAVIDNSGTTTNRVTDTFLNVIAGNGTGYRAIRSGSYYGPTGYTPGTVAATQGWNYAVPIWLPSPMSISTIQCKVTTAGPSGTVVRLGAYLSNPSDDLPSQLIIDAGTVAADTVGVKSIAASAILPAGLVWLTACCQNGSATLTSVGSGAMSPVAAPTAFIPGANAYYAINVSGAFPATYVRYNAVAGGILVMVTAQ